MELGRCHLAAKRKEYQNLTYKSQPSDESQK